ncbi:MAG: 3-hydroxyacyl-CoA dehydrogenase [Hyphomicrobiaceae bacterium]
MALDASRKDLLVGVIGTGAMGRGIMQVAALGGLRVVAFDTAHPAAIKAKDFIAGMLSRAVAKGSLTQAGAEQALDLITIADKIEDLKHAHVIVEAVIERLDVKQELFAKLDDMTEPDTILASNTSSLPITAIAAKCRHPQRTAGLHFFNPVPLMKLVEVIPGLKTAPWASEALMTLARRMTREPVLCADSPGFIVNHIGRAYVPEAARILSEGIARHDEIDRIMTGAPGLRMGPFTLLDLVGADVSVSVMESLWTQFYSEPMYATQPLLRLRTDGGLYGQKTGAGWYTYHDGKKEEPPLPPAPARRPKSVWVNPKTAQPDFRQGLVDAFAKTGVAIETADTPSNEALIVLTPVGWDVTSAVVDLRLDGARTVAVDPLFGLTAPRTLMVSPATAPDMREAAHGLLAADGQAVVVVNDSPGFVAQRIVAHIVNVACQIAQRGIASPADIDKGAKLGLSYPFGPLEWGDRLGPRRVLHILERLAAFYGEPRYRPSPWLKRRAMLNLSLLAPDR